ncbi:MAG: outer membrane lipid asymmetry maintenance protein MlaD [Brachymonas sp.]|nr:outer membrane lipid asymmetry maintenance protein MlaD [Brachymonas sp.]
MQRSKVDVWVGLFVLAGAVALLFLALQAGNLLSIAPRQGYQIRAVFQDIGGLKPKAAVKSAGVVVGRVKAIEFDNQTYQAVAVLDMDGKYQFPNDSLLKIMTSGLLGDQYVGVEAGYGDVSWKPDERVTNTQSAIVLENLIGQFMNSKALEVGGSSGGDSQTGAAAGADAGAGAGAAPAIDPLAGADADTPVHEADSAADANDAHSMPETGGDQPQTQPGSQP